MAGYRNPTREERDERYRIEEEAIANEIIQMIEDSSAPWMKPWSAGAAAANAPRNPVTGTVYKGINQFLLLRANVDDPRWYTHHNAREEGYVIPEGAPHKLVSFWKFESLVPVRDEEGNEVKDDRGKTVRTRIKLSRPLHKHTAVFNASHLRRGDGSPLPPPPKSAENEFDPIERGESVIRGSGARIVHNQVDRNFYSQAHKTIFMTPKSSFDSPMSYYSTACHELAHWTMGPLKRDIGRQGFGSKGYALEELRAEIASYLIAVETGLPHDPQATGAYLKSWAKAVREDPNEIRRAVKDAEGIVAFLLEREREYNAEHGLDRDGRAPEPAGPPPPGKAPDADPGVPLDLYGLVPVAAEAREFLDVLLRKSEHRLRHGYYDYGDRYDDGPIEFRSLPLNLEYHDLDLPATLGANPQVDRLATMR